MTTGFGDFEHLHLRFRLIGCIHTYEGAPVDDDIYVWEAWIDSVFIRPEQGYVLQVRGTKRMFWDNAAFFITAQRPALPGDREKLAAAA